MKTEEDEIIESITAATRSGKMKWNYDRKTQTFSPKRVMRYVEISVEKNLLLLEIKDSSLEISGRKARILWALLRGIQAEKDKNSKEYILRETKEFIEGTIKRK